MDEKQNQPFQFSSFGIFGVAVGVLAKGLRHRLRAAFASLLAVLSFLCLVGCLGGNPASDVDCSRYSSQSASPYVLPYEVGESFTVTNTAGHGSPQTYAIDFRMPMGTRVNAARDGRVIRVVQSYSDNDHEWGHENRVWVRDADDTVARYFHLTRNGARVAEGEDVVQGRLLGLSGDSGNSREPHLHFDVSRCTPDDGNYNNLPCGETIPVTFRNTTPHACGLVVSQSYRAEPY